jgi:hypothetical protein
VVGRPARVLELGIGFEYWHNMFGKDANPVPGADQLTPVFALAVHLPLGGSGHRTERSRGAGPTPRSRPVFPYPALGRYSGRGDPNDASSYGPGAPLFTGEARLGRRRFPHALEALTERDEPARRRGPR